MEDAPPMITAATLSIGDEILLGQSRDSNAPWIARRMLDLGVTMVAHAAVGDDRDVIASTLRDLARRAGIVISTGGLGPTADDLTREALTDVVDPGCAAIEDPAALAEVEAWFTGRGRPMPPGNRAQARRPPSARSLTNDHGTAPGLHARIDGTDIFCLPGPPREMHPMFERCVAPIASASGTGAVPMRLLHACGLGESEFAQRLGALMDRHREILVGTTASGGIVTARIRARHGGSAAEAAVASAALAVRAAWHPFVFGEGGTTLAESVGVLLRERGQTVAVAESCTGGLLAARLVDPPGASHWFRGGWMTYANERKVEDLGVPADLIARHGAVSREVALAMADGARRRAGADWALSTTGVAGPDGGTAEKPVGLVWIGIAGPTGNTTVHALRVPGDRAMIRDRTVLAALQRLRLRILSALGPADAGGGGMPDPLLLWEVPPGDRGDGAPLGAPR
ncbi:MAG: competence/damage-inducible protein A [Phycisphaeraceae bacterium]|nr:competence/damage-inducible protein A [Phycisphaeraceae bacterium]